MPDWVKTDDATYVTTAARIAQLEKAVPSYPAPGKRDFNALLSALTGGVRTGGFPYAPLPRDPQDQAQFGPMTPFTPSPIDEPGPEGRTPPRVYEYPVAWNLELTPAPHIPFRTLRDASYNIDMVRRCIELRKKEIAARDWSFTVAPWAVNLEALKNPGSSKLDIQARMNKDYGEQIGRANAFWRFPGKNQDYSWGDWLYAALEQYLVYDALVVYPDKTFGGDLIALDIVSGETIKPLLSARGTKPAGSHPAYQQVLYGFPRGEYTATVEAQDGVRLIPNPYTRDQLYYIRRHTRPDSPYGMSAVEQALISARLYLKRQGWMLSEYDDGTVPMAWIESVLAQGEIEMDANQRRMWEEALNDELSGNTAARHRLKVMPPGMKAVETSSVDERYKPDYDLFLIKLLASHFDVPVSELGFSESKGLGSAGFHEGQADSHERKATLPDTRWMSEQVSRISHEQLALPREVIHKFTGLDDEDEAALDSVWENRTRSGRATLNEDRARLNLPLYEDAEANMPMLMTQRGIVFIGGSSKLAPPGDMVEPAEFKPDMPGQTVQQQNAARQPAPGGKAAELAAFRKWAKAHPNPSRPFEFKYVTPDDAPDLVDDPRVSWE